MEQRRSEQARHDGVLDPELAPIVAALREKAASQGSLEAATPAQMRVRASEQFRPWNTDGAPLQAVRDFGVGGVPVRLYVPSDDDRRLLVYLHGGGWVVGDLELEDAALRRVARRSGVRILSIDYRLVPEHPFPAQLDDIDAVITALLSGATDMRPPLRLALGGASAGANLAAGAALRLRDRGGPVPAFLLLLYGAYAGGRATPSWAAFGDGRYGLSANVMRWFWQAYSGAVAGKDRAYAIPIDADLAGLPPVFASYAELDVLRDDTVLLAQALRAAGVSVDLKGYPGMIHGFTQYAKASAVAARALDDAADALAAALS